MRSPDHGEVLTLLGTFSQQPEPDTMGPSAIDAEPPELPPYGECVPSGPPVAVAATSGFGQQIHARYHPDDVGFGEGEPSGTALVRGWFEFADHSPVDAFGLLLAVDAFAPVSFNRPEFPVSWEHLVHA